MRRIKGAAIVTLACKLHKKKFNLTVVSSTLLYYTVEKSDTYLQADMRCSRA